MSVNETLASVYPVQLVKVPEVGVPKAGVTKAAPVALTKDPLPVIPDAAGTYSTIVHAAALLDIIVLFFTIRVVLASIAWIVFKPPDCTVTTPVDRFVIIKDVPVFKVPVVGNTHVCVVLPVNTCCCVSVTA